MSDKNKNAAAEAVAALKSKFEAAETAFNAITETTLDADIVSITADYNAAKKEYEEAIAPKATTPKASAKTLKGKFIVSPTGKYNLGYNVGESASLPELQAKELEEAGYFKLDK